MRILCKRPGSVHFRGRNYSFKQRLALRLPQSAGGTPRLRLASLTHFWPMRNNLRFLHETVTYYIIRGATALLVAVATPRLPRRSEAKLLQFVPINAHATWLSRSRAMATKRKTRQHSQLSQHGEFWHVSVS